MKWFQHDTKALSDAKIEKLIMKYGIEGYGLYFACVEIIAGNLSGKNINFELEHDAEILAHKFRMDTLKVQEIMKYLVILGLFEIDTITGRVSCMKLLKRLDESTSKNPEIRRILENSENFRKIPETPSTLPYPTLPKITLHENKDNRPTIDEVKSYIVEKGYKVDAESWYAHYESNGWLVGKNKMKSWKGSIAYWERNTFNKNVSRETKESKMVGGKVGEHVF